LAAIFGGAVCSRVSSPRGVHSACRSTEYARAAMSDQKRRNWLPLRSRGSLSCARSARLRAGATGRVVGPYVEIPLENMLLILTGHDVCEAACGLLKHRSAPCHESHHGADHINPGENHDPG